VLTKLALSNDPEPEVVQRVDKELETTDPLVE